MIVLKYRKTTLLVAGLITILAALCIPKMKAKYNFEEYFPQNDEAVHFYREYAKSFDSDARLLLLGFKNEPSIFEKAFLENLDSLNHQLSQFPDIKKAIGITQMTEPRKTPFGILERPILKIQQGNYEMDSLRIQRDSRIMGTIVSKDFQTTCLLLEVQNGLSESAKDSLITAIDDLCGNFPFSEYHIGGDINTEVRYIRMLERENLFLLPLFLLATTIVLVLLYRSFFSLSILTVSVLVGLIWLFGYAALIGRNLNIATLMFPTIMVVVGMSDLIHFYTKYNLHLAKGLGKMEAIRNSLKELRKTLFLTSLTTAIGFLTLAFSSVPHVKTFGLDATVGVWLAFIIAITLTPALLTFLPKPKSIPPQKPKAKDKWIPFLQNIENCTKKYPVQILTGAFLILMISLWGILQLDTNSYLLGNISEKAPVRKDFMFFEKELSGVRALEMAILAKEPYQVDSLEVLKEIEQLESFLSEKPSVGTTFSPVTFYKSMHKAQKSGQWKYYKLPDSQRSIERYNKQKGINHKDRQINADGNMGRLTAKMKDLGRLETQKLNEEIEDWIRVNIDSSKVTFQQTGSALLIDKNNEHLIKEMFQSLGLAFLIISLLTAYLFKNIRMVFISLIPNILPLVVTAGFMGFAGIELNGSSAMIFTISFVIAVDDTIHFLSKFRIEKGKGIPVSAAISNTLQSTGKAIIITSLILAAGYAVCLFSEFREAYYHGVLICFTLLWAMIADLLLLPVLLRKFG